MVCSGTNILCLFSYTKTLFTLGRNFASISGYMLASGRRTNDCLSAFPSRTPNPLSRITRQFILCELEPVLTAVFVISLLLEDISSADQQIPPILRNPNVHCRIHKHTPPVSILIQINPVHASLSHVLKLHFNSIPHLRLGQY